FHFGGSLVASDVIDLGVLQITFKTQIREDCVLYVHTCTPICERMKQTKTPEYRMHNLCTLYAHLMHIRGTGCSGFGKRSPETS
ncbi:hypothetical protein, partial [Thalassobius sp. I31.1]|uniref:hypothetical protein n=1 Tax=Thalassobius sp. I31.1 TaxID=2109912 RepID=UPI001E639073